MISMFSGCSRLKSITFPNKLKKIGDYAFHACIALKSMKSKALYPPTVGPAGYSGYQLLYTGKLIVPVGSKDSYATHSGWGHCNPIVEED